MAGASPVVAHSSRTAGAVVNRVVSHSGRTASAGARRVLRRSGGAGPAGANQRRAGPVRAAPACRRAGRATRARPAARLVGWHAAGTAAQPIPAALRCVRAFAAVSCHRCPNGFPAVGSLLRFSAGPWCGCEGADPCMAKVSVRLVPMLRPAAIAPGPKPQHCHGMRSGMPFVGTGVLQPPSSRLEGGQQRCPCGLPGSPDLSEFFVQRCPRNA
jgi:hypothetical protein